MLEVVVASAVLIFGIVSVLTVLQSGLQAADSARNYTKAAQLMQNEIERLRLNSWSQIETLESAGAANVEVDSRVQSHGTPFTCVRTIRDVKPDMKEITLESTWHNYDGRPQRALLVTRYSKSGLYDYFYTDSH